MYPCLLFVACKAWSCSFVYLTTTCISIWPVPALVGVGSGCDKQPNSQDNKARIVGLFCQYHAGTHMQCVEFLCRGQGWCGCIKAARQVAWCAIQLGNGMRMCVTRPLLLCNVGARTGWCWQRSPRPAIWSERTVFMRVCVGVLV